MRAASSDCLTFGGNPAVREAVDTTLQVLRLSFPCILCPLTTGVFDGQPVCQLAVLPLQGEGAFLSLYAPGVPVLSRRSALLPVGRHRLCVAAAGGSAAGVGGPGRDLLGAGEGGVGQQGLAASSNWFAGTIQAGEWEVLHFFEVRFMAAMQMLRRDASWAPLEEAMAAFNQQAQVRGMRDRVGAPVWPC